VFGQSELVHRTNASIDDAKNDVCAETLARHAGAKSSLAIGVGEIGISALIHQLTLRIGQKAVG
jgi:hypothetical protein